MGMLQQRQYHHPHDQPNQKQFNKNKHTDTQDTHNQQQTPQIKPEACKVAIYPGLYQRAVQ